MWPHACSTTLAAASQQTTHSELSSLPRANARDALKLLMLLPPWLLPCLLSLSAASGGPQPSSGAALSVLGEAARVFSCCGAWLARSCGNAALLSPAPSCALACRQPCQQAELICIAKFMKSSTETLWATKHAYISNRLAHQVT